MIIYLNIHINLQTLFANFKYNDLYSILNLLAANNSEEVQVKCINKINFIFEFKERLQLLVIYYLVALPVIAVCSLITREDRDYKSQ